MPQLVLVLFVCVGFATCDVSAFAVTPSGTIEGVVVYKGSDFSPKIMKVVNDQQHCGREISIHTINIHGPQRTLSDAVVSLEGIITKMKASIETQRSVLNMQCSFAPRISIARKGQEIEVRNQDPILHNTHIKLGKRTFLNVAQVPNSKPVIKRLKHDGLHIIRCDKHVFMEAYLHVFSHPYYALTNQAGEFRIFDVPPGRHSVRVWHEALGILEKVVDVPPKGTVRLDFAYR